MTYKLRLLVLVFVMLSGYANAQLKRADITQGKYLENTSKNNFIGNWTGSSDSVKLKLSIRTQKRHIKRGTLNVYLDFLIVKINQLKWEGKDIYRLFENDIELVSTGDDVFSGIYKDPATKNNMNLLLENIYHGKLKLSVAFPEMDPINQPEKGSVFPKQIELTKQDE